MKKLIEELIKKIGEDPEREGLIKTPERVGKSLKLLTSGYSIDPRKILRESIFIEKYDEMVILKDIDIFSLCEHHLLPFFGRCHIGYVPNKRIVGLSKLAKVVDAFSKRLQVQERLTFEIAQAIRDELTPLGVGVVIEATHLCMIMRGIGGSNSVAITSAMFGVFKNRNETRMEFMNLIKKDR